MSKYEPLELAETTQIGGRDVDLARLPAGYEAKVDLGIVAPARLKGSVVYRTDNGTLFETRAIKTSSGEYLLMFPTNTIENAEGRSHYGGASEKRNDLVAFRSKDRGRSWNGPTRPIDIDYTGMSVMRMDETRRGTWLIGAHEGDWSYRPLMTRQYILRSEDQGMTWELQPGRRHAGWHAPAYNRMDEGRPISLADGRVLLMARTPEGHLWQAWSEDDGKSWSDPTPSPLVHPDAPPMVFHLSDGDTLAAFHHNRSHDKDYSGLSSAKEEIMKDRSEIWVSLSKNGGEDWGEPRFVFSTAVAPRYEKPFFNYQCSYMDMFLDGKTVNLFVPHLWHQVLHLQIEESDLIDLSDEATILD